MPEFYYPHHLRCEQISDAGIECYDFHNVVMKCLLHLTTLPRSSVRRTGFLTLQWRLWPVSGPKVERRDVCDVRSGVERLFEDRNNVDGRIKSRIHSLMRF